MSKLGKTAAVATSALALAGGTAASVSASSEIEPGSIECHVDGVVPEAHIRTDGKYEVLLRGLGQCGLGTEVNHFHWNLNLDNSNRNWHVNRTRGAAVMLNLPDTGAHIDGTFQLGHGASLSHPFHFHANIPPKTEASNVEPIG